MPVAARRGTGHSSKNAGLEVILWVTPLITMSHPETIARDRVLTPRWLLSNSAKNHLLCCGRPLSDFLACLDKAKISCRNHESLGPRDDAGLPIVCWSRACVPFFEMNLQTWSLGRTAGPAGPTVLAANSGTPNPIQQPPPTRAQVLLHSCHHKAP